MRVRACAGLGSAGLPTTERCRSQPMSYQAPTDPGGRLELDHPQRSTSRGVRSSTVTALCLRLRTGSLPGSVCRLCTPDVGVNHTDGGFLSY